MSKIRAKQETSNKLQKFFKPLKFATHPYKIIFLVCVALYAQILTFGLVHFDDHGFVLMASDTLKLANIPEFFRHSVFWVLGDTTQDTDVFYRPLQNTVYAICNTLSPKQAWGYHLMGLLLHIATGFALYRFLKELNYSVSVCLVFALLYCVHPILVQGVAWIAGMGDQMAAFFSLLSVIYFIRLFYPDRSNDNSNSRILFPLVSGLLHLFFLTCALFSKEISIALIPLCLFWIFFLHKNKFPAIRLLTVSAGWGISTLIFFILRSKAIYSPQTTMLVSAFDSFKKNGALVFEYFEKIFLPYRLSPIPSREDAQLLTGTIIFLSLIALFIFSAVRRGPSILADRKRFVRMSLFGALWFVFFLFPAFIQQNTQSHFFVFEHRLYLPLIGIAIMLIELLNINQININSGFQQYGFLSVLLIFFTLTLSHSRTFTDPYTFYDKAIRSSPQSVIAYNGYGKLLLEHKKYEEAIEAFKKSFRYKSDDLQTSGKIAEIYLKNLNNPREAIAWFKKTVEIDPYSVEAAVSIGDAYFNFLHDTSNAITWYSNAIKINPRNEFALANLGVIYASKGKIYEARKNLSDAIESNSKNLTALKWMAISYFNEGKIKEAINYLNKGYEYYPNDADIQSNLMICYYKLNDFSNTEKFASLYSANNNSIPAVIASYLKNNSR